MTDKTSLTYTDKLNIERALNLLLVTIYESEFLENLRTRYLKYGDKMVITDPQRKIVKDLALRFLDSRKVKL